MTDAAPTPDAGLSELEAELKSLRERSGALLRRSRAFSAKTEERRSEGLVAKLRKQLGLG